jgi:hypothetical protein
MRAIDRSELREQAKVFAGEMVGFLEEQNKNSARNQTPLRQPREALKVFERHFMRFVARHRLVKP